MMDYWTQVGFRSTGKRAGEFRGAPGAGGGKFPVYFTGVLESCRLACWGYSEECGMEGVHLRADVLQIGNQGSQTFLFIF